jgi:hypothetical protein
VAVGRSACDTAKIVRSGADTNGRGVPTGFGYWHERPGVGGTRLDLHGHRQTVVPGMQKAPALLRRLR